MIMKKISFIVAILIACNIHAQNDTDYTLDSMYIDFSVPDLSAFSFLDIESDEIVRPGNMKKLAYGISNYLDSDGTLRPGFALEYSPLNFSKKHNQSWWERSFRYEQFALTSGTVQDDSLGLRFALGFKWVPYDKSDPFGDNGFYKHIIDKVVALEKDSKAQTLQDAYISFLNNVTSDLEITLNIINKTFDFLNEDTIKKHEKEVKYLQINAPIEFFSNRLIKALDEINIYNEEHNDAIYHYSKAYVTLLIDHVDFNEKVKKIVVNEKKRYKEKNWNASSFLIAGGIVGNSTTCKYNDLKFEKLGTIFSYAQKIPSKKENSKIKSQALFQFKLEHDVSDVTLYDLKWSVGSRTLIGNANNRLSIDIFYSASRLDEEMEDYDQIRYLRYTIGTELKLDEGTWLELAFGGQSFFEGDKGTAIIPSFGFKHAINTGKRKFN